MSQGPCLVKVELLPEPKPDGYGGMINAKEIPRSHEKDPDVYSLVEKWGFLLAAFHHTEDWKMLELSEVDYVSRPKSAEVFARIREATVGRFNPLWQQWLDLLESDETLYVEIL